MLRTLAHLKSGYLLPLLLALTVWTLAVDNAHAATSAGSASRTETLAAGPYIIDVQVSQDPPFTDTPFDVIVTPHDHGLQLQGRVTVRPGLGTDAVPLHFNLTASADSTLKTQARVPVQGAWDIVIELQGPKGAGEGSFATTAAAPGAIPVWLGWVIGASPLVFVAAWIWLQHRYRNRLMQQVQGG